MKRARGRALALVLLLVAPAGAATPPPFAGAGAGTSPATTGQAGPAGASTTPAPGTAAAKEGDKAAPAAPPAPPLQIDKAIDTALKRWYARAFPESAAGFYAIMAALPDTDLRRDTAIYYLARSLAELGYAQAAEDLFIDIVAGRRSPELVGRSLGALDELLRARRIDDARLVDEVLFGNQYGDLPPDTGEFVEYHQALAELRRGFTDWGTRRLERLSASERHYGWKARYALAVERLVQKNDEGAEKLFQLIVDAAAAPAVVKDDARQALARQRYDQQKFDEAFALYSQIDKPLPMQDLVLLEKAWDRVAAHDEPRALGMVVGLGAPVYHRLFAPERDLIRAVSLKRLCQFRAAHLSVLSFRGRYGELLERIHDRQSITDDPFLKNAVAARDDLQPAAFRRDLLRKEKARLPAILDKGLRGYLVNFYETRGSYAELASNRQVARAFDRVAEELLRVDEQMTILDYEIGVGLFKTRDARAAGARAGARAGDIPFSADGVYYKFSGEYWSDELQDFVVFAEDRCVR